MDKFIEVALEAVPVPRFYFFTLNVFVVITIISNIKEVFIG